MQRLHAQEKSRKIDSLTSFPWKFNEIEGTPNSGHFPLGLVNQNLFKSINSFRTCENFNLKKNLLSNSKTEIEINKLRIQCLIERRSGKNCIILL